MAKKKKKKKAKASAPAYAPSYVAAVAPAAPAAYSSTAVAPAPYVPTAEAPAPYESTAVAPEAFTPGEYNSQYADQLSGALNTVTNWKYNPLEDASYQALAKIYGARGNQAAKNTLADAAALNGGYGTSYSVSAAQQARNQYNQELAALIPDLEANAFNRAQTTYAALKEADDTAYGRFRDNEGDRQWQYTQNYNAYRDKESDNQWKWTQNYNAYRDREADNQWQYTQNYNAYRDKEADNQWLYSQNYQRYQDALDQYRWGLDYNTSLYQWNKAQKKSSGGGGGRRSGGGGGGYSGGSVGGGNGMPISESDFNKLKNKNKTTYGPEQSTAQLVKSIAKSAANKAKKRK